MSNIHIRRSDVKALLEKASREIASVLPDLVKAEKSKEASASPEASSASMSAPSASPVDAGSAEGSSSASSSGSSAPALGDPTSSPVSTDAQPPMAEGSSSGSESSGSSPEGTPGAEETPGELTAGSDGMGPAAAPSDDGSGGALEAMFHAMPPEMVKAMYVALKKVIFAKHVGGGVGEAPASPTGADDLGSTPPAPTTPPEVAKAEASRAPVETSGNGGVVKNEESVSASASGSPDVSKMAYAEESMSATSSSSPSSASQPLSKNETEVDTMADKESNEKLEKLEKSLDGVLKVLELALRPQRKAVTSLEGLNKSEPVKKVFTKEEIDQKLISLSQNPQELKKSDRDLIVGYYEGNVDFSALEHLFNK